MTDDVRDDLVRHSLAVLVPVVAVLELALLVVPDLPVDEQDTKVDDVKVRDRGLESSGETPGPAARTTTDERENQHGAASVREGQRGERGLTP